MLSLVPATTLGLRAGVPTMQFYDSVPTRVSRYGFNGPARYMGGDEGVLVQGNRTHSKAPSSMAAHELAAKIASSRALTLARKRAPKKNRATPSTLTILLVHSFSRLMSSPRGSWQGNSLRTWSYRTQAVEAVQVFVGTEGRPLDADIELWNGPDNTPVKMRVFVEDGFMRPFNAVIETPREGNTIAVRNIGQI